MQIDEQTRNAVDFDQVPTSDLQDEIRHEWRHKDIVGRSAALKRVLRQVEVVGPTDSTVLITGETGTGKELIARAINKSSRRSGRPFVSVNCAALSPSLISSELFGHERGAFTGAVQRRVGRFERAHSGTIFLDEVGELSAEAQVALLRILQEREFERVGGTQSIQIDVRVLAATNRDLGAEILNGKFRSDLFYRLNVFPIELPPLRERKDDIQTLLEHFVKLYALRTGKTISSIDNRTLELFHSYHWPGNIRELQNVVERAVILSQGDVLCIDEAWFLARPVHLEGRAESLGSSKSSRDEEREIIEGALAESRGRISGPSGAAARLKMPASTLEHRIRALKISKVQFRYQN
jgi:transcriptional regulator with GAF, ATPase, and Fis domain